MLFLIGKSVIIMSKINIIEQKAMIIYRQTISAINFSRCYGKSFYNYGGSVFACRNSDGIFIQICVIYIYNKITVTTVTSCVMLYERW